MNNSDDITVVNIFSNSDINVPAIMDIINSTFANNNYSNSVVHLVYDGESGWPIGKMHLSSTTLLYNNIENNNTLLPF